MAFRWKDQQNQQPVNMGGQAAYDASVAASGGSIALPDSVQPFEAERQQIADLERQLAEIDMQIEKFDRENPGFNSGMVDVAAKRAEAGDMGAYNSMVQNAYSRQLGEDGLRKSGSAGVWNSIDEARKLAYDLDNLGDETRGARIANIRVMLDKARRDASASGMELPNEWYELDRKISQIGTGSGEGRRSLLEWGNTLWSKAKSGELRDSDIDEMKKYIAKNEKGELSKDLQALVSQYEGKTVEARERYKKKRDEAVKLRDEWNSMNVSSLQKKNMWNGLQKGDIRKQFFNIDKNGNLVDR